MKQIFKQATRRADRKALALVIGLMVMPCAGWFWFLYRIGVFQ